MHRLHGLALRAFSWIPWPLQRVLIGIAKPAFVVGTTAAITNRRGQLLLVRHSYKPGWSTPGGFVNRREPAADAVVREVWEELGLRVAVVGEPVCIVRSEERIVELVDELAADRVAPSSAEIAEARWFDADDLPELSVIARNGLEHLERAEAERAAFDGTSTQRLTRGA
jgi:ADP-ribose pyrophosphatase YjhB (NUDIX family)